MHFTPILRAKKLSALISTQSIFIMILLVIFAAGLYVHEADAKRKVNPEQAERVIVVKDYKWASGGKGRPGIMQEITLENKGQMDYQNIEIEVDFYTTNDIPLGSLRSTIYEVLPAGSEKTFYNLQFGLMHSELKNSIARVAGAEVIEKGSPTQAKDLIHVKNWEWTGGSYGTEGIIKEITLENNSTENWKDIKIRIDFLGLSGGKVGVRGFTSRAIIHDILPARSERTYKGINVGFRHPDAKEVSISVMSAKPVSEKEVRYRQAKKDGKSPKQVRKKRKSSDGSDGEELDSEFYSPDGEKLSLSQRYKKKLEKEQGLPEGSLGDDTSGEVARYDAGDQESMSVRDIITKPSARGYTTTQVGDDEYEDYGDEYEYEEEVPLPKDDIVVEDFVWGGGVTQTIGFFKEITLQNISSIDYTKIDLKVDFFSFTEETPMFSNRVTIVEVLPAHSKKTFKNVKAGFLNAIPEEVRVEVLDAIPFSQY
jgi:hypothetical protein